jgi:hypothetical protein
MHRHDAVDRLELDYHLLLNNDVKAVAQLGRHPCADRQRALPLERDPMS